jgi:hypothetical protein
MLKEIYSIDETLGRYTCGHTCKIQMEEIIKLSGILGMTKG